LLAFLNGERTVPKYVVGFAFGSGPRGDLNDVALIQKLRPAWQHGYLNGPGGHIERGETALEAVVREFHEEAGLYLREWDHFATLQSGPDAREDWTCHFFRHFNVDLTLVKTMTDEEIVVVPALDLPSNTIWNLRWLIPLALDHEPSTPHTVIYRTEESLLES
jgi:8-oxo-dGTP diphosphatase